MKPEEKVSSRHGPCSFVCTYTGSGPGRGTTDVSWSDQLQYISVRNVRRRYLFLITIHPRVRRDQRHSVIVRIYRPLSSFPSLQPALYPISTSYTPPTRQRILRRISSPTSKSLIFCGSPRKPQSDSLEVLSRLFWRRPST